MISYRFFAKTDLGLCRGNNEDSFAFDEDARIAILADGMGGYNAGEVASNMATASIQSELGAWLREMGPHACVAELRRAMEICVDNTNASIFKAANLNPEYAGMGTTLVLSVFQQSTLLIGHIGDSRCYRMRQGVLTQLTKDHSLLQEHIDAGLLSTEQARHSSIKNLVTRALGVQSNVVLEIGEFSVEPGDIYLMCSDGLSDMVEDSALARIMRSGARLPRLAAHLINEANANGGGDNVSVLLMQARSTMEKRGLMAKLFAR